MIFRGPYAQIYGLPWPQFGQKGKLCDHPRWLARINDLPTYVDPNKLKTSILLHTICGAQICRARTCNLEHYPAQRHSRKTAQAAQGRRATSAHDPRRKHVVQVACARHPRNDGRARRAGARRRGSYLSNSERFRHQNVTRMPILKSNQP